MQIALYGSHHSLPFWGDGQQPTAMFDPDVSRDWIVKGGDDKIKKFSEWYVWPILMGLYSIDCKVLAHVSVGLYALDEFEHPKRIWVQITTLPMEKDEQTGFPLVVRPFGKGKNVEHLWGGDNRTYSPLGFPEVEKASPEDKLNPRFWQQFFTGKLLQQRDEVTQEAAELAAEAQKLRNLYGVLVNI